METGPSGHKRVENSWGVGGTTSVGCHICSEVEGRIGEMIVELIKDRIEPRAMLQAFCSLHFCLWPTPRARVQNGVTTTGKLTMKNVAAKSQQSFSAGPVNFDVRADRRQA